LPYPTFRPITRFSKKKYLLCIIQMCYTSRTNSEHRQNKVWNSFKINKNV